MQDFAHNTGCLESVGQLYFLYNSAKIQPIELKFDFLHCWDHEVFRNKKWLNLVIELLRSDSAKIGDRF
jgi:hypothetical protein